MSRFRICSMPGCYGAHKARGWCANHYARWMRTGSPEGNGVIVGDDEARFWSKVDASGDCWLWTGYVDDAGYGQFHVRLKGRNLVALPHRYAWELLVGLIPDELQMDHLCRVRHCVNPDHLEPVTPLENTRRGYRTGRGGFCRRGHALTPTNTSYNAVTGSPYCRRCKSEYNRRYWRDVRIFRESPRYAQIEVSA